jgi:tRNA nucleotidyltransferase (CCA-adding enzyme)
MRLSTMSRRNSSDYKYLVLLSKIKGVMPLNDLVLMTKCDKLGRLRDGHKDIEVLNSYLDDKINRLGDTALDPYISGEDLFELGVKQGPKFKELIDWSYDLQMRKHSKEDIIRMLKEEVENDK